MKKIHCNNLEKISGGVKCGTVGILTGLALASFVISPGGSVAALNGLSSSISDCWNS